MNSPTSGMKTSNFFSFVVIENCMDTFLSERFFLFFVVSIITEIIYYKVIKIFIYADGYVQMLIRSNAGHRMGKGRCWKGNKARLKEAL